MTRTLFVDLPSSTLYVSGTVNGVATVWTNTEGNTWESIAERSEDDKYAIELTIVDNLGQTTNSSITLYYGVLNLITDRTQADVDRVLELSAKGYNNMTDAEKEEWRGDLKGAYNATDLNRVESAVAYLAGRLRELPTELREYASQLGVAWDIFFDVPYNSEDYNVTTKTDWVREDIPTLAQMQRYIDNVSLLRKALKYDTSALPAEMIKLSHRQANAIEEALKRLHDAINAFRARNAAYLENTSRSWYYSGELYTGEVE